MSSQKEVFSPGSRALGTWVKMTGHESIEILAHAGFDFVTIDMEHAPLSIETVARHISLASALGIAAMVRIPNHDPSVIQKVLDCGAHGLFVPRVDTLEQAKAVAAGFSFPPHGTRGAGGTSKAGLWGTRSTPEYLQFGRESALLIVQIEAESGVRVADQIAAIPAINGLFVGAADLSMALGETPASPTVNAHIDSVIGAAHDAGKICGLAFGAAPSAVHGGFDRGIDFALTANDTGLLAAAALDLISQIKS